MANYNTKIVEKTNLFNNHNGSIDFIAELTYSKGRGFYVFCNVQMTTTRKGSDFNYGVMTCEPFNGTNFYVVDCSRFSDKKLNEASTQINNEVLVLKKETCLAKNAEFIENCLKQLA